MIEHGKTQHDCVSELNKKGFKYLFIFKIYVGCIIIDLGHLIY